MGRRKQSDDFSLSAIHENELESLLRNLGLLDELNAGNFSCRFCGKKIKLENLQCIYPLNNEIVFCCDKITCFQLALQENKEANK